MFNILFLPFLAIAIGITIAILITRKAPLSVSLVPPEEDFDTDTKSEPALTLTDLTRVAERMCSENGLTIKDRIVDSPEEMYWVAESKNEFFFGNYVLGFLVVNEGRPFATMRDILDFKDLIKSHGSTKGFFFTSGYFTRDVHQPLEGPKVTLYNRKKVLLERKNG